MKHCTKTERSLLTACFPVYTAAYISRCNLSPSMDHCQNLFRQRRAGGSVSTFFAVPCAGQVFSGLLADRLPRRRLMLIGTLGSAMVNAVSSFCPWFPLMVARWFVNGLSWPCS